MLLQSNLHQQFKLSTQKSSHLVERDVNGVARALHDGISQDLVALAYRLEILASSPGLSPAQIRELRSASHQVNAMTQKVRDQIFLLRTLASHDLHLLFQDLKEECTAEVTLSITPELTAIPDALITPLADVVTELVRNAERHARATRIEVEVAIEENLLLLKVSDDGQGGVIEREGHYGLQGVREVVDGLDGELSINEGEGTQIWVNFPISPSSSSMTTN